MPPQDQSSAAEQPYKYAKVFRDRDGVQWFAHEVTADALGTGRPSLLLVSTGQVRRVSEFPASWRELDGPALLALPYSRV